MKFSEWQDKLNEQQKRLNDLALSEATESISIPAHNSPGSVITITLGKGKYESSVNGSDCAPRFLRPLYTNNKEEFDAMLESLTQQTDLIARATEVILESVSEEALPQAVIARMKGDKVSGDPSELVKTMTEKKMSSLVRIIKDELPLGNISSIECDLGGIAKKTTSLTLRYGEITLQWGGLNATSMSLAVKVFIGEVEEAMFFLANYEIIKERVLEFVRQVKAIK